MLQGTPCDIEISSTIYSGKICSVHMYNTFILEFQINTMSRIKNNSKVPKYSRAVSIQECVMMAQVQYFIKKTIFQTSFDTFQASIGRLSQNMKINK